MKFLNPIKLPFMVTPSDPAASEGLVYFKPDGRLYTKVGSIEEALSEQTIQLPGFDFLHARLARAATRSVRVVFLGSSTTYGNGASFDDRRFVNVLTAEIQKAYPSGVHAWEPPVIPLSGAAFIPNLPGVHVANGGIGGTTSANYCPSGTVTDLATFYGNVIVHTVGANDYRFSSPTPTELRDNVEYAMLVIDAYVANAVHIIVGTYAMPAAVSPTYPWSSYLSAMREAAESHPRGLFVDASPAFAVTGIPTTDPMELIADTVHPTDAGHSLLGREVARLLQLPQPPVTLPPPARDQFARKSLGNLESGQPWVLQGGVYVPDGKYLTVTTAGNVVFESGFSDAEVSALCTHSVSSISGVIAKSTDAATRIGFYLTATFGPGSTPAVVLYRGTTLLATSATLAISPGREYHMRLLVKGDQVLGYFDGKLVISYTLASGDATTYSAYTSHGFRANATTGTPKFRNLSVRPI